MNNQKGFISAGVILQMLFFVVGIPLLPLLISWRWNWREAWVYAAVCILGFAISRILAARQHPDLIAERARTMQHEDIKPWDKVLGRFAGFGGILIMIAVGLDALFGWSHGFSMPVKFAALAVILASYAFSSWALIENRFFSSVVRIQKERDHQVVSSGPYRWVRHPGYAGALWLYLATPLFLDSVWAFIPAVLLMAVLVIRTGLEDRTLQEELDGYREYAQRVRYRLFPGIW
jgi:protein-S-isoprenylcysteine O-methyltransferase Ste14